MKESLENLQKLKSLVSWDLFGNVSWVEDAEKSLFNSSQHYKLWKTRVAGNSAFTKGKGGYLQLKCFFGVF